MLNPQLQQSLDDLLKDNVYIKDFVYSPYWKDTMFLISSANHIKDQHIIEGIELEIILILLNVSNYTDIYEALKGEVFNNPESTITEATIRRICEDIKGYLFEKINQNTDIKRIFSVTPEDIREDIHKQIEHKELLPDNYINNRSSKIIKKLEKVFVPDIKDIYREKLTDKDMLMNKYTVNIIKPKDRVKKIVK